MEFSSQEMDRLNSNPLYQTIGILIDEAKGGKARSHLRPNPALCWPFDGQPHGGILFTLMDTTMAWAILTVIDKGYNCVTINLDIQYARPAVGESFVCQAGVTHQSSQIVYTRADILDKKGQLTAAGQGTFRIIKAPF